MGEEGGGGRRRRMEKGEVVVVVMAGNSVMSRIKPCEGGGGKEGKKRSEVRRGPAVAEQAVSSS